MKLPMVLLLKKSNCGHSSFERAERALSPLSRVSDLKYKRQVLDFYESVRRRLRKCTQLWNSYALESRCTSSNEEIPATR